MSVDRVRPFDWIVNVNITISEPRDEEALQEYLALSRHHASLGFVDEEGEYDQPRTDIFVSMLANGRDRFDAARASVKDLLTHFPSGTRLVWVSVEHHPELGKEVGYV